jgi:hypothetical protein
VPNRIPKKFKWKFYQCGRCKGDINYLAEKGPPQFCSECGYGFSSEDVNNVPAVVRLNLGNLHTTGHARYGKCELTTIVHR